MANMSAISLSSSCLPHNKQFEYCHQLSCSDSEESSTSSLQLFSSSVSSTRSAMLSCTNGSNSPTSSATSKSTTPSLLFSTTTCSSSGSGSRKRRPSDEFEYLQTDSLLYCSESFDTTGYSGVNSKRMAISGLSIATTTTSLSSITSSRPKTRNATSATTSTSNHLQVSSSPKSSTIVKTKTINAPEYSDRYTDPVYLEDEQVFRNLIRKERYTTRTHHSSISMDGVPILTGEKRNDLLSWMLQICRAQFCQDEIFALSTMILDKFLLLQFERFGPATIDSGECFSSSEESDELFSGRLLCLYAAASLLLATKFRQTPQLPIDCLCESSLSSLTKLTNSTKLKRRDIKEAEFLILTILEWDLASFVTPNDYLDLFQQKSLLAKVLANLHANATTETQLTSESRQLIEGNTCNGNLHQKQQPEKLEQINKKSINKDHHHKLELVHEQEEKNLELENYLIIEKTINFSHNVTDINNNLVNNPETTIATKATSTKTVNNEQECRFLARCDESRVRRHTQKWLELCLMGKCLTVFERPFNNTPPLDHCS